MKRSGGVVDQLGAGAAQLSMVVARQTGPHLVAVFAMMARVGGYKARVGRITRAAVAATGLLLVLILAPRVRAQPAPQPGSADDTREAERLFDEGRALMMEPGELDRACETLSKSLALMVRGDTYLNLAECHRRQGKTATAWREFGKALEHAESVKFKEAIETAKEIRSGLEAKLSSLTVKVADATAGLQGLSIKLNGEPFLRDDWGRAMVLDPQSYKVEAAAEGYQPFVQTVELGDDSDAKEIAVVLEPVPPPAPAPPAAPPPAPTEPPPAVSGGGIHPLAIIGFAVGAAGFVTFAIFGALSIDRNSDFDDRCPDDLCPEGSEDAIDEAILFSDLATVGLIVGAVGTGAGVVGLLLDTDDNTEAGSVQLNVGPGSLWVRGTF
jgi:hypothetical protein